MMQELFHQPVLDVISQHGNARKRLRSDSCSSVGGNGNFQPTQKRLMLSDHKFDGGVCQPPQNFSLPPVGPYPCINTSGTQPPGLESTERGQPSEDIVMNDQSLPTAPRSTGPQRPQPIIFSMGYRAECEKCRMKVPGHYSHIIRP